jgi:hypothetical protein
MQRIAWLALFSLTIIGGLFAISCVTTLRTAGHAASDSIVADVTDVATPLPKGDRLLSRFFDNTLPETPVETVKIVPIRVPKQSEASKDDVVSWHWHEGAKVVRRQRAP